MEMKKLPFLWKLEEKLIWKENSKMIRLRNNFESEILRFDKGTYNI